MQPTVGGELRVIEKHGKKNEAKLPEELLGEQRRKALKKGIFTVVDVAKAPALVYKPHENTDKVLVLNTGVSTEVLFYAFNKHIQVPIDEPTLLINLEKSRIRKLISNLINSRKKLLSKLVISYNYYCSIGNIIKNTPFKKLPNSKLAFLLKKSKNTKRIVKKLKGFIEDANNERKAYNLFDLIDISLVTLNKRLHSNLDMKDASKILSNPGRNITYVVFDNKEGKYKVIIKDLIREDNYKESSKYTKRCEEEAIPKNKKVIKAIKESKENKENKEVINRVIKQHFRVDPKYLELNDYRENKKYYSLQEMKEDGFNIRNEGFRISSLINKKVYGKLKYMVHQKL